MLTVRPLGFLSGRLTRIESASVVFATAAAVAESSILSFDSALDVDTISGLPLFFLGRLSPLLPLLILQQVPVPEKEATEKDMNHKQVATAMHISKSDSVSVPAQVPFLVVCAISERRKPKTKLWAISYLFLKVKSLLMLAASLHQEVFKFHYNMLERRAQD
ncbi:uncharacterized protein [Elaeis guineensis]|uniref:uncharacterized protein n=1 Tax=Elaeis guineensis var. tenera TaxID=51953 RepID=UPI003C6D5DB6